MNEDQTAGLAAQKAKHEVASYERLPSTTPDRAKPGPTLADQMVAMRDGVKLASDIYLPEGDGPFSTILTRMPYGKTEPYCYMPVMVKGSTKITLKQRSGIEKQLSKEILTHSLN